MDSQKIYLGKVSEAVQRMAASDEYLASYEANRSVPNIESAVLQARKALECVALAAIAPNRGAYEKFRLLAEKPADYRKDYNARAILQYLAKVNPDFYPSPLLPPKQTGPGQLHFDQKTSGYLTKKQFETFYDRLGKYLHADNPWGTDKGVDNLVKALPQISSQLKSLLELHRTIIRTPTFSGVWVVEVPLDGRAPSVTSAAAAGPFVASVSGRADR